jgi:hypothetical protein
MELREANSSSAQQIIVAMVNARLDQLEALFDLAVDAITAAFGARRIVAKRVKNAEGKKDDETLRRRPGPLRSVDRNKALDGATEGGTAAGER